MSRASWASCCSLSDERLLQAAAQVTADNEAQRARWAKGFTRRSFLAGSGFVLASSLASQLVTTRYAYAAGAAEKTLVVVFLRGGLDGLSAVVPRGDVNYSTARPKIGIPDSMLKPLNSTFGLHPSLSDIKSLWDNRSLAFVHASGSTDANRDHFASQSLLERGTTLLTSPTGWLDRALEMSGPGTTFRSVSEGPTTPRSLGATTDTVALQGLDSLVFSNPNAQVSQAMQTLYTGLDSPVEDLMDTTLTAVAAAGPIRQSSPPGPQNGAVYTDDDFGRALADIARMVRSPLAGLRVATVDVGGWDVHSDAGTVDAGTMTTHLKDLGRSLGAFAKDLGSRYSDVTLVCMSEFGRRVGQNSSGGTDHGFGGLMMVMGGSVNGGQVAGGWPGLAPADLFNGDLPVVNDYRNVLGELAQKTLNLGSINNNLFPSYNPVAYGLMRA